MNEIVIAFDIDGTILNNEGVPPGIPPHLRESSPVNLEIVLLLRILSKNMKNTRIIAWSGGGKDYCEQMIRRYGLGRCIAACYSKDDCLEKVDICFDDVHACTLADKNIIVKMK